ncbi:hypothetical protein ACQ4PT_035849 [Festuca glaucescens]
MPVFRTSVISSKGSGPREAIVPALRKGFELSWTGLAAEGECGICQTAGGFCGRRRAAASQAWAFSCFANDDARAETNSAGFGQRHYFAVQPKTLPDLLLYDFALSLLYVM